MPDQSSASAAPMSSTPRPALARLAAEADALTVRKLWKALTVPERTDALRAAFDADEQGAVTLRAAQALVKAKRYRPQTVAAMNQAKIAAELAPVPIDDAVLLDSALVDFHFAHRRSLMAAFLDAAGIAHEEGRLPEDTSSLAPGREALRAGAEHVITTYPADDVYVYFLTLALQSRETWGELAAWLRERAS